MAITLVPLAAEHADLLQGILDPSDIAQILAQADLLHYRAVFDGDVCVGVVALKLFPGAPPEVIVSTVPAQRRKGYATAAVLAIVRYAFEEVNVAAVYAKCEVGRPSNRVVEKNGFCFLVQQGQDRLYELKRSAFLAAQNQR